MSDEFMENRWESLYNGIGQEHWEIRWAMARLLSAKHKTVVYIEHLNLIVIHAGLTGFVLKLNITYYVYRKYTTVSLNFQSSIKPIP